MSIATKTGDDGTTGLMFGRRVSKTDPLIEACGSVDELNAALGTARASLDDVFLRESILAIQRDLITLMGEVGVAAEERGRYLEKGYGTVTAAMVDRLTGMIDNLEENHPVDLKDWAIPGATVAGAGLDVARTTCRRAERRVIEAGAKGESVRYLNRLSDLCWLWARFV
ncbi:MAG: cob(I)yrinic acid a,c-diamide adenosyltransferase [Nitrospiraceae bacterium]|nr:cob(I)yrinic acid a,c-diamide adenosyltransferase [Nitrospiraceae bacterium]